MTFTRKNISSLRVRFAFGFGILFTFFLAAALIFIYISFAKFRKDEWYARLKEKAVTTYNLLIEVNRIDSSLLREIDRNTPTTAARQVMVFKDSTIIYNSSEENKIKYDPVLFNRIKTRREYFTTQDENEVLGLYYQKRSDHFSIIAFGYDRAGFRKLVFLKWVMLIVYLVGIIIGWIVVYFFVKKVIKPLDILKNKLNNINYNNLGIRLPESGQGEEVNSLSANFNQMLARLEQSFSFQKDFVHYASHELRTPLAAMVGLTENSMNSKNNESSKDVFKQLLTQQRHLTDITNSLLLLSGNKINSNGTQYPLLRLDELVFRSVEIIKDLFPQSDIEINFVGEPTNENYLLIHANEPLVLMAFNNLLKNALQYAEDNKIEVVIDVNEEKKQVKFVNKGKCFSEEERERLFTPFYRGSNSTAVKGHGLGLALVKQIAQLHNGFIEYSYENGFNAFTITFTS